MHYVLAFVFCLFTVIGAAQVTGAIAEQNAATAYAVVRADHVGTVAIQNAIDKAAFIADFRR